MLDLPGYLTRLGPDSEPPSLAAPRRMRNGCHMRCWTFTSGSWHHWHRWGRLARILRGRGGSCYHLKGAFSALPRELAVHHAAGDSSTYSAPWRVDRAAINA